MLTFTRFSWLVTLSYIYVQGGNSAHAGEAIFSEEQVKKGVEEAAVIWVCPNQTLLEIVEVEADDCASLLAELGPVCWHLLDKIVSDYTVEDSDDGKKRFLAFSVNYASCIQSELLTQAVRGKKKSRVQGR